jgi:ketosteroid isomerase-like protein
MSDSALQAARLKCLQDFANAWNAHDLDALMAAMSDDCVFHGSAGSEIEGTVFEGREAVAKGYARFFEIFPDAQWNDDEHWVAGDKGVSAWRFTGTTVDGQAVEMNGCDLFEFEGDKIRVKDSYRKQRT